MKRCNGCGSVLQCNDVNGEGYTWDISKDICSRCFRLVNYGEYKVVVKDNEDYLKVLEEIDDEDLVVYVSSLINLNMDYIDSFKRVLLVLTKRDVLPKSVVDSKIVNYVERRVKNLIGIEVISSVKNYNLDSLFGKIKKENKSSKVYFVGNTNSGKSTLVNKLVCNYFGKECQVAVSMYPSTTLDKVSIKLGEEEFIDTPGLIDQGSIINYIDSKMLKMITPKKEIKPLTYQLSGKGTLLIANLVRLEYECFSKNSMTVYINNGIAVKKINDKRTDLLEGEVSSFTLGDNKDIVITDLGFLKFVKKIKLKVYTYKGVRVYERDNLI